jgi:ABC transporter substrate binding protein
MLHFKYNGWQGLTPPSRRYGSMPTLRALCTLLCCMALVWPQVSIAQQSSRVPRIGFLMPGSQESYAKYLAAFVQGLRELGRLENRDYFLDPRWADGQLDRLPLLATELVDRKIDVLVVSSAGAAIAARNATTTLPIVQASGGDPVLSGLAASLRDPKGNLTGISNLAEDLSAKSLEQLLHMVPGLMRVGVLVNPLNKVHQSRLAEVQRAASMFHVEAHPVMASPTTLDQAIATLGQRPRGAFGWDVPDPSPPHHRGSSQSRPAGNLPNSGVRPGRRAHELRHQHRRQLPSFRRVCGSHPEGGKACRLADRASGKNRACDQCEDRERTWPCRAKQHNWPCRRAHRMRQRARGSRACRTTP